MWLADRPKIEMVVITLGLICVAIFGSWISTQIRAQRIWPVAAYLSGIFSIGIWAYLSRYSKTNIVVASLWFDIVYNITWTSGLMFFGGESISLWKGLGVALILAGVAIFGL